MHRWVLSHNYRENTPTCVVELIALVWHVRPVDDLQIGSRGALSNQVFYDPPSGATKRCALQAAAYLLVCVRLRVNVDHGEIIRATLVWHDCWHIQKRFPVAAVEGVLQHTMSYV